MVEPILYASLGALLATLIGLLFLPIFWRRAVRLTTKRLIGRLPVSAAEIVAAQDRLRAEFAMSMRATERKAERTMSEATRDRVESARARSTELGHLADLSELRSQISFLESEGVKMRGERDKSGQEALAAYEALEEARAAADAAARDMQAARQDASAARAATDQARVETSARVAEINALRARLAPLTPQAEGGTAPEAAAATAAVAAVRAAPRMPRAETPFGGSADEPPLAAPVEEPSVAAPVPAPTTGELAALRARLDEVADALVKAAEAGPEPAARKTRARPEPPAAAEPKVAESKSAESKSAGSKPVEPKPVEPKPVEPVRAAVAERAGA